MARNDPLDEIGTNTRLSAAQRLTGLGRPAATCAATNRKGKPCKNFALTGREHCWHHEEGYEAPGKVNMAKMTDLIERAEGLEDRRKHRKRQQAAQRQGRGATQAEPRVQATRAPSAQPYCVFGELTDVPVWTATPERVQADGPRDDNESRTEKDRDYKRLGPSLLGG